MKKFFLTAIALATMTVATQAQESTAPLRLTLDECLRIALNENPTIKVAQMEIQRVDYSRREVLGQLLPDISFSAQYSRSLAIQTVYMGDQSFKMGRDNSYNMGFNASIPLVVPQLWKSLKLSDNQILQNVESARASRLSLVNQVKNAYYTLLLAQDSKKVIEENHKTAQFNADVYKKKHDLGAASEYDVLRANVEVTNLEPSIIEAENSITQLKLQLKVLMGMDVAVDIEPAQTLDAFKGQMYSHSNALNASLENNTSLKQMELQTDYLNKALDVQKAAWWPTVSGGINYMWNSTSMGSPFKNFKWNPYSTASISVAIPLFTGGQRLNKQRQAEIAVREMKWQRENLERSLQSQVIAQVDLINKSLKQVESNAAGVTQAVKANDIMQESFKIGVGSFIQLLDTQDALMASRLTYYQAIYNYLVADSDLELLLGNAPIASYATPDDVPAPTTIHTIPSLFEFKNKEATK